MEKEKLETDFEDTVSSATYFVRLCNAYFYRVNFIDSAM